MEADRGCQRTCLKGGCWGCVKDSQARCEALGSGGDRGKVEGRPLPEDTALNQHQLLVTWENWGQAYQIFKFYV